MNSTISLNLLGWQPFYQRQLSLDEFEQAKLARVIAHHRSEYVLRTEQAQFSLPITSTLPSMALGDWLLVDESHRFIRQLERKSLFKRKAPGTKLGEQLIAANVDSLFIVCSLNHDFNLSRIERYLALAYEADVEPILVLTKQDLCDDTDSKRQAIQKLDPLLMVVSINALDSASCEPLVSWCRPGRTVSLLGSSGVGKSTLINTLMGDDVQMTGGIREDDSKGRHTTTARSMHFMPSGAVLIDTPGMRELQLTDCEDGVNQTFADVDQLAQQCRFSDCQHNGEPGCAVQRAVHAGELDPRRLDNYFKLMREQARNGASLADLRAKEKQFGKMVKSVMSESKRFKKAY